jgi:hypothetical protein
VLGIHYLDEDEIVLDGVRFLGATLWSDSEFLRVDQTGLVALAMREKLTDVVRTGLILDELLARERAQYDKTITWLAERLTTPFPGPTVVVTHHPPTPSAFLKPSPDTSTDPSLATKLDELVSNAKLWISGHIHRAVDARVGNCRVLANPRGYPDESTGWNPRNIVHVSDRLPIRVKAECRRDPAYAALKAESGKRIALAIEESYRNGTLKVVRKVDPITMKLHVPSKPHGDDGPE